MNTEHLQDGKSIRVPCNAGLDSVVKHQGITGIRTLHVVIESSHAGCVDYFRKRQIVG